MKTKTKKTDFFGTDFVAEMKNATKLIRTFDNKFRIQILHKLHVLGEANVSQLYESLGMQQETCSSHLKALRNCKAVKHRREKKSVYYSLDYERLGSLMAKITDLSLYFCQSENHRP